MLIAETIRVALGALRANKLRSLLTMLGIVIGVAAVIAVVALGRGAQKPVNDRIAALGTTLLTINPGQARQGGVRTGGGGARLTMDDADALEDRGEKILAVQPEMSGNLQVAYLNKNTNTSIVGVTANYPEVRKYEMDVGRFFTNTEDLTRQRVAVVGHTVLDNLNVEAPEGDHRRDHPHSQHPVHGGRRVQVEGADEFVRQPRRPDLHSDQHRALPRARQQSRPLDQRARADGRRDSGVDGRDREDPAPRAPPSRGTGRRLPDPQPGRTSSTRSARRRRCSACLLAGIAAVSLLVGGIGIMNIMLVSVTERTREIGIRKALGATKLNILFQFLIEAVVLCLLGGTIGIMVGAGGAVLFHRFAGWNTEVGLSSVVVAFAFSAFVGVVFGVYPARRAAGLDPITALRYE